MDKRPNRPKRATAALWRGQAGAAGFILIMAASAWVYRGAFRCLYIQDDYAWLVTARFQAVSEY
jgi:hypothetical protein